MAAVSEVLETVNHAYVIFYLLYITFIVFAAVDSGSRIDCRHTKALSAQASMTEPSTQVIRVISAVFLSQTLEAANNDAEMMIQERLRKKANFVHKLEGATCYHLLPHSISQLNADVGCEVCSKQWMKAGMGSCPRRK